MRAHDYSGRAGRCHRCGVTRPEGVRVGCEEIRREAYLVVPTADLKALRETLAISQTHVSLWAGLSEENRDAHRERLNALIENIDRHRPLGADGTHGDHHTETCGCDPTERASKCDCDVIRPEPEFPAALPAEPAQGRIVTMLYGGPFHDARANLLRTPPHLEIRGMRYERVDDPDSGDFLGLYVYVSANDRRA